mgnify:CR=1 FL=1
MTGPLLFVVRKSCPIMDIMSNTLLEERSKWLIVR